VGLLGERSATVTRLLVVQEIHEDDGGGATLKFEQLRQARLSASDPHYSTYLRLAQRSKERQHPVGVSFRDEATVGQLTRADSDVPTQLVRDEAGPVRVIFQGHDGVFRLQPGNPESVRIGALLDEAIRRKARVWFIAQKPCLAILDVLPAGWPAAQIRISFVVAPEDLLRTADEILHSRIRSTKALVRDIRAVAKAYIDETDEMKRAVRDVQTNAARVQIYSLSPPEVIDKAKALRAVQFPNKELQDKVRAVASSYVLIAEKNQQLWDEFKKKYRGILPPPAPHGVSGT
jgi:hypothetical protein